jgi:hypothetical protein
VPTYRFAGDKTPIRAQGYNIGRFIDTICAGTPDTIVIVTAGNGTWQDALPAAGTNPFRGAKGDLKVLARFFEQANRSVAGLRIASRAVGPEHGSNCGAGQFPCRQSRPQLPPAVDERD